MFIGWQQCAIIQRPRQLETAGKGWASHLLFEASKAPVYQQAYIVRCCDKCNTALG